MAAKRRKKRKKREKEWLANLVDGRTKFRPFPGRGSSTFSFSFFAPFAPFCGHFLNGGMAV
jgi:hypothetical protein